MKPKEIADIYWFCQAVAHGGYAAASAATNASPPTLSRAVTSLEETLGEKLLHRNAKLFKLTAAGELYYQRFAPICRKLNEEWELAVTHKGELVGEIRISCPEPFADKFLQPAAIEFMQAHPRVTVSIDFSSDTQSFFEDQIDLAISTQPPQALDLIQRKLFQLELALAAAPSYIEQFGMPATIDDLLSHDLLAGNKLAYWDFIDAGQPRRIPVNPKYAIDSLRLVIRAATEGLGICLIPVPTLATSIAKGELQRVLPDAAIATGSVYLVWADRKLESIRARKFREMLIERLSQEQAFVSDIAHPDF